MRYVYNFGQNKRGNYFMFKSSKSDKYKRNLNGLYHSPLSYSQPNWPDHLDAFADRHTHSMRANFQFSFTDNLNDYVVAYAFIQVFAELKDLANEITSAELVSPTLIVIGKVVALSPLWPHTSKEVFSLLEAI